MLFCPREGVNMISVGSTLLRRCQVSSIITMANSERKAMIEQPISLSSKLDQFRLITLCGSTLWENSTANKSINSVTNFSLRNDSNYSNEASTRLGIVGLMTHE